MTITTVQFQNISITSIRFFCLFKVIPCSPVQTQSTANPLSRCTDLPLLGILHKWSPRCDPLCLPSFTQHSVLKFICVVVCINISSLFIAQQYSIVRLLYILCIHSRVDRHLGCFFFFIVMNNTAMNSFMQVFVWMQAFIYYEQILRRRIAGLNGTYFRIFLQNKLCICKSAYFITFLNVLQ